jgi:hypothetical protein
VIDAIRDKIRNDEFEFSKHAVDQTILRKITVSEIREIIASAEIIEDYPEDKYGPSCLLFGATRNQRPLHLQTSYPTRPILKIITAYQPDPNLWIAFRHRRLD